MKGSKKSLPPHYDSIYYLSALNWKLIHDKADLSFLLLKKQPINESQQTELSKVWEKIVNEYSQVFGYGANFVRIIEKKLIIIALNSKMVLTGDASIQTLIDIEKLKLENLEKIKGGDIMTVKKEIEKRMGIRIPLAETSVFEFYSYLKDAK